MFPSKAVNFAQEVLGVRAAWILDSLEASKGRGFWESVIPICCVDFPARSLLAARGIWGGWITSCSSRGLG